MDADRMTGISSAEHHRERRVQTPFPRHRKGKRSANLPRNHSDIQEIESDLQDGSKKKVPLPNLPSMYSAHKPVPGIDILFIREWPEYESINNARRHRSRSVTHLNFENPEKIDPNEVEYIYPKRDDKFTCPGDKCEIYSITEYIESLPPSVENRNDSTKNESKSL